MCTDHSITTTENIRRCYKTNEISGKQMLLTNNILFSSYCSKYTQNVLYINTYFTERHQPGQEISTICHESKIVNNIQWNIRGETFISTLINADAFHTTKQSPTQVYSFRRVDMGSRHKGHERRLSPQSLHVLTKKKHTVSKYGSHTCEAIST